MSFGTKVALLAAALGLAVYIWVSVSFPRSPEPSSGGRQDLLHLKMITAYVIGAKEVPMTRGGQLDPYRALPPNHAEELCHSARLGTGPSRTEIEAGNYRNFPYVRIATPFSRSDKHETAILWDGSPQQAGVRIVALDSGTVRAIDESEFAAFLEAHAR